MQTELIQCATAGCGHSPFPASADFISRARKTGEWFYCPSGHTLSYGEGADARERRELRQKIKSRDDRIERLTELQEYLERCLVEAHRTCPWVACGFVAASGGESDRRALHVHMRAIHGMPTLAQISEAS